MLAQTLVLDTGYQPISIISWEKAFCLWVKGKVEIVEEHLELIVRSARQSFKVPSVVRFVKNVFGRFRKIKFCRQNIYKRDKGTCQYCGLFISREDFTIDHLTPKSKGGISEWTNVVVSCGKCNSKKGSKTLEQAGMKLLNQPIMPKNLFGGFEYINNPPDSWRDYLASCLYWHGELEG